MSTEKPAAQLHDKATRGIPLSAEEQAELDAWYAEQDRAEDQLLGPANTSKPLNDLHVPVEQALTRLLKTAQQIQYLATQNDALRRKIAALQNHLAQTLSR
ncbi:MAG: hypothetical protein U1F76_23980 [Candidatus Competibacteraceae bacterium]